MTAEILDFRIEVERRIGSTSVQRVGRCEHKDLVLEAHGQIVRCHDCGDQVDAFWALERLAQERERVVQAREKERSELEALREKTIHLKAARKVEKMWRGKRMVPLCPHCHSAIFAGDGLGDDCASHDLEARRRKENNRSGR